MTGFVAFHKIAHVNLGIRKYFGLYFGSMIAGYYGDKYLFNQLSP